LGGPIRHWLVVSSAVFFAASGGLAKWATLNYHAPAWQIALSRYVVGLVLVLSYVAITGKQVRPRERGAVFLRAVFNAAAILLFYAALQHTTLTNATLLNLTYPVFVAILGPVLLKEHLSRGGMFTLAAALLGVCLVIDPEFGRGVNRGDIMGLFCGISAAGAVLMLRRARRVNDSITILAVFYVVGTAITAPVVLVTEGSNWSAPCLAVLGVGSFLGVLGQFALTLGIGHVTAAEASIVSTSRAIFATTIGVVFFSEVIGLNVLVGGTLVIGSVIVLSRLSSRSMGMAGDSSEASARQDRG